MTVQIPPIRLLIDPLEHWASTTPDAEALSFAGRHWTWAQWRDRVQRAAGHCARPGSAAATPLPPSTRTTRRAWRSPSPPRRSGPPHAIANWRLSAGELQYILTDCRAKLLFVGADFAKTADELDLPDVQRVIVVGGDDDQYEAWLAAASPSEPDPDLSPEDVCLVMYSSGTTGRPKGVMLSHRNLAAHTINTTTSLPYSEGDRNLVAMPLFHVGGTSYAILGLSNGVPSSLCREPDPASLFAALAEGCTHAFLVPAVVNGILAAGEPAIAAFGRLKRISYGAAPMPLPLLRRALAAFPATEFVQGVRDDRTGRGGDGPRSGGAPDEGHPERLLSAGTVQAGTADAGGRPGDAARRAGR